MELLLLITFCMCFNPLKCAQEGGPDPWHYKNEASTPERENIDVIPDLRMSFSPKRNIKPGNTDGSWFFKRMLAIILKGGQYKRNEDHSVDVSVQMKFDDSQWATLNEYLTPNIPFSEEMFRRSVGLVENAIYKPSISERIVMAWKDYIQFYLIEYKIQITMALGVLAAVSAVIWLWNHMSHKHFKIILFAALYLYEVFVSYKEADQKEFERYLSAINACKWYFWSSSCEVPPPDPINFLKYMNPLKIVVRMFTTLISEPMITISATVQTIIHGITDGMWFPLDKIMHGLLTVSFTVILVILLVMIVFTYLLNIPFKLSFLAGLVSVGVNESMNRSFIPSRDNNQPAIIDSGDRISGATLDRILDVCSRALNNAPTNGSTAQAPVVNHRPLQICNKNTHTTIKRSASTGRLQEYNSHGNIDMLSIDSTIRKRGNAGTNFGGGDAF